MKTSDIMNTLVAGFLDGKAGLKATEAIPAGATVGVNWESGEVFVEKRGMDSRRPGPVKEYVEPDFRALNETAERVKEHHVHGFDLAENNYRTAYTLNAPVPDCIYLRIDHLSSENSQVNDLVELTEVRCTRLRLKGFIGTP